MIFVQQLKEIQVFNKLSVVMRHKLEPRESNTQLRYLFI